MYKLVKKKVSAALSRRRSKKKKMRGSTEISEGMKLAKAIAVAVVVVVVVIAIGSYVLNTLAASGVGNSTIYSQGSDLLTAVLGGFGNAVQVAIVAIILVILAVIVQTVQRW
jgi:hypothetical protein